MTYQVTVSVLPAIHTVPAKGLVIFGLHTSRRGSVMLETESSALKVDWANCLPVRMVSTLPVKTS